MTDTLYDKLGIDKNASPEDIKSAYRKKAKINHPDKPGGQAEGMAEISRAYSILSDPRKKERYDATGQESETPFEQKFMSLVQQTFNQIIENQNVDNDDLIYVFKIMLDSAKDSIHKNKQEHFKKLKKFENVRKRITSTNDNAIVLFLDGQIASYKTAIANMDDEIIFMDKAKEVLESYNYNFDEIEQTRNEYSFIINNYKHGRE